VNGKQLFAKLCESAKQHGDDSEPDMEVGDLQDCLREAISCIESCGMLETYRHVLAQTVGEEQLEFEWLLPDEGYVIVPANDQNVADLFYDLRQAGFELAAATVQNSGDIPAEDFKKGLKEIGVHHPSLARRYRQLFDENYVKGKND
jgi:hypothetical protein